jgi:hypothetical protein
LINLFTSQAHAPQSRFFTGDIDVAPEPTELLRALRRKNAKSTALSLASGRSKQGCRFSAPRATGTVASIRISRGNLLNIHDRRDGCSIGPSISARTETHQSSRRV